MFVRDNMFRALAQFDTDFTRHIEGHTLRLHWDEYSLFHLVNQRLRAAFEIDKVESDVKVWNRFAHRDLKDREGFSLCLHHTLYRPRDILVLLNEAYANASREGREAIIETDIESSARRISENRLEDLLKEYDTVLPGLKLFVSLFRGRPAQDRFNSVVGLLGDGGDKADYREPGARDFGLFNSGREIFSALYSVGFIGLQQTRSGGYAFCHDGSASSLDSIDERTLTTVHPCYWKALDLQGEIPPEEVVVQINDEYKARTSAQVADFRLKLLGEIQGALPRLPQGPEGSREFENWVLRTARILFSGKLWNIEPKPNPGGIQQRDIVATNMAEKGFWRRILDDYKTRQVIFEVKNYPELGPDDFRQVLSYSSGEYGGFAIIVSRAESENLPPKEKDWVRLMWHDHQRIIMVLPALVLARCVSKLRSPRQYDYTEDLLNKNMDLLVRSYLNLAQTPRFRRKKRNK